MIDYDNDYEHAHERQYASAANSVGTGEPDEFSPAEPMACDGVKRREDFDVLGMGKEVVRGESGEAIDIEKRGKLL